MYPAPTEDVRRRRLAGLMGGIAPGLQRLAVSGNQSLLDTGAEGLPATNMPAAPDGPNITPVRTPAGDVPGVMLPKTNKGMLGGSTSQETYNQATALDAAPAEKTKGFWRRLGSGGLKDLRTWGENGAQGGLGGLVGALGAGALGSAISPTMHAEWSKDRKSKQLWNRYGEQVKNEQEGAKLQQEILKGKGQMIDNQQKQAKPYMEAAMSKDFLTDDEIEHLRKDYNVDLPDVVDKGNYLEREINGVLYTRRRSDPHWVKNTSAPVNLTNQPVDTEVPGTGGKLLPLKPGQTASMMATANEHNISRMTQAERDDTIRKQKESDAAAKLAQSRSTVTSKAEQDREAAAAALQQLQADRAKAAAAGNPTTSYDTKIADMAGKQAAALKAIQQNEKVSGNKNGFLKPILPTETAARRRLAAKGLSPEQIDEAISKLKADQMIK